MLVNRSVLCNCGTEAENNFLLESPVACHNEESKLIVYFMVNTTFVNYLHGLDNVTDSLKFPILLNRTTYEQTLPISLESFDLKSDLLRAPKTLKDFAHQFQHKREIFDLQERQNYNDLDLPSKNFFFNNYTVDIFSVCYCYNFISGCNYSYVYTMEAYKTKISNNQSCFTANKRCRHVS